MEKKRGRKRARTRGGGGGRRRGTRGDIHASSFTPLRRQRFSLLSETANNTFFLCNIFFPGRFLRQIESRWIGDRVASSSRDRLRPGIQEFRYADARTSSRLRSRISLAISGTVSAPLAARLRVHRRDPGAVCLTLFISFVDSTIGDRDRGRRKRYSLNSRRILLQKKDIYLSLYI